MTERFFIVGAQRSGTTYLYHLLDAHPEIEMARPVRPEPKFFMRDDDFAKGLAHYERTFFAGKPGAWLKGEKSTSYLESAVAAGRIARCYPDARILVMVRDPVARAVSHWRFSRANGVEPLGMAEAFAAEGARREAWNPQKFSVSPFAYLRRGRYMDDIAIWERHFPRERIRILVHETFVGNARAVADLYAFLGVAAGFVPQGLGERVNASAVPGEAEADLPDALRKELAAGFADANTRLAAAYGLDLGCWRH